MCRYKHKSTLCLLLFISLTLCSSLGLRDDNTEQERSLLHDTEINNRILQALDPNVQLKPDPDAEEGDAGDFETEISFKPSDKDVVGVRHRFSADEEEEESRFSPVKRMWGVADSEAIAGTIFEYPIPDDAFVGDVKSYQVT